MNAFLISDLIPCRRVNEAGEYILFENYSDFHPRRQVRKNIGVIPSAHILREVVSEKSDVPRSLPLESSWIKRGE